MKNIPIPRKSSYLKCLIEKVESLIRRMRWKAHFHEKKGNCNDDTETENYGFKSDYAPPQNENLNAFENDIYEMIRSVKFRPVHNAFLSKMKNEISKINSSSNLLVFADKTTNMYEMTKENYENLLMNNITKCYKKADETCLNGINNEAKQIACKLKLDKKIKRLAKRKAFITLKDHKENFTSNTKCRLINPAKSEVGIVSKAIVERINTKIRHIKKLNQWQNTSEVITWFKNITNKHKCKFLKFDIVDFYPSITEHLLTKSLTFAQKYTEITQQEIKIIKHARKSLLFSKDSAWKKRNNNSLFDVTMGSFDGAEICELVGLYILEKLTDTFGKNNIGLYRDDGLATLYNKTGSQIDRAKKALIKIFKENDLAITVETNYNLLIS